MWGIWAAAPYVPLTAGLKMVKCNTCVSVSAKSCFWREVGIFSKEGVWHYCLQAPPQVCREGPSPGPARCGPGIVLDLKNKIK